MNAKSSASLVVLIRSDNDGNPITQRHVRNRLFILVMKVLGSKSIESLLRCGLIAHAAYGWNSIMLLIGGRMNRDG